MEVTLVEQLLTEIRDKQSDMAEKQAKIAEQLAVLAAHRDFQEQDIKRAFRELDKLETKCDGVDGRVQSLERAETLNERIRAGVWAGVTAVCIAAFGIVSMAWDSYQIRKQDTEEVAKR